MSAHVAAAAAATAAAFVLLLLLLLLRKVVPLVLLVLLLALLLLLLLLLLLPLLVVLLLLQGIRYRPRSPRRRIACYAAVPNAVTFASALVQCSFQRGACLVNIEVRSPARLGKYSY